MMLHFGILRSAAKAPSVLVTEGGTIVLVCDEDDTVWIHPRDIDTAGSSSLPPKKAIT
jgi:hypothetical protein